MQNNRYVVDAVILEGRSIRDVAHAHGVSKSWVAQLVKRYREGGYQAITPRSRTAHRIPNKTPPEIEDQIIALRKLLSDDGLDAGAQTIQYHLSLNLQDVPSVTTIWRVLRRRGFVTPQPQKRPRSSWIRFEADLPNECWQSDITHWHLSDGTDVQIVNFIDDHSRLAVASKVLSTVIASDIVEIFTQAALTWGYPASVLTDNGAVYTATSRKGRCVIESELLSLGITYKHSRPYHPQTCGKVERFHQTMKSFLAKQSTADTTAQLQAQVDRFIVYYNNVRPHRSRERITPKAAFDKRDKATPIGRKITIDNQMRVRHDRVDRTGVVTLRYRSRMHHIGIGRAHQGKRVILLIHGLDIRVLTQDGELLRHLTLNPSRDYQRHEPPKSSTMT